MLGGWPVQHHTFSTIVERGGDLQTATDRLEISGEQLNRRDRPMLDMADSCLRYTHPLSDIDLAQPGPLTLFDQSPQRQLTAQLLDALGPLLGAVERVTQLRAHLVPGAPLGHDPTSLIHCSYRCSASSTARTYQRFQSPALSPATSRTRPGCRIEGKQDPDLAPTRRPWPQLLQVMQPRRALDPIDDRPAERGTLDRQHVQGVADLPQRVPVSTTKT